MNAGQQALVLEEAAGVTIEVQSEPDSFGRQTFMTRWPCDNEWRGGNGWCGQVFHAVVSGAVEGWRGRGREVRVLGSR